MLYFFFKGIKLGNKLWEICCLLSIFLKMVLPEAVPEEYEEVRNILTPQGLWQTFNGDEYDVWAIKVINILKLQDLWHFIAEEDPIDP